MTTYHVELTAEELKLTHSALRSLLADLSHDDHELLDIIRGVLAKMPPAEEIAAIRIEPSRRRRTPA
ncbi:MAG TPA: hypothetical protein VK501_16840 [Baekduia sp.]|uniref:hypothetical protein n=1 Tax=Baekduia sp. TaxID=2600305 RepID=UPI002CB8E0A1|nr:hypothetical protein [Baekduia sp.]HMJ35578.1 hypothetical protein [Baekduia sp.]